MCVYLWDTTTDSVRDVPLLYAGAQSDGEGLAISPSGARAAVGFNDQLTAVELGVAAADDTLLAEIVPGSSDPPGLDGEGIGWAVDATRAFSTDDSRSAYWSNFSGLGALTLHVVDLATGQDRGLDCPATGTQPLERPRQAGVVNEPWRRRRTARSSAGCPVSAASSTPTATSLDKTSCD